MVSPNDPAHRNESLRCGTTSSTWPSISPNGSQAMVKRWPVTGSNLRNGISHWASSSGLTRACLESLRLLCTTGAGQPFHPG